MTRTLDRITPTNTTAIYQWVIFVVTVSFVVAPILPIFYQAFMDKPLYDPTREFTLGNVEALWNDLEFRSVINNSLVFASLTTIFAQFFGALFAILIGRTDLPIRKTIAVFMLWPLALSAIVLGFGWSLAYGPGGFISLFVQQQVGFIPWSLNSIVGMSIIAGTTQVPLAFLYCYASVQLIDSSLEDASRVSGASPMRTLTTVTLPLLMPSILYGTVLNFTAALETLAIPLIFGKSSGIRVFTTFLYSRGLASIRPNHGLVATAALVLLAVICTVLLMQSLTLRNSRRFVTVGGKSSRSKLFPLGYLRWPLFVLCVTYVVTLIVVPVGVLVLRAFTSFITPFIPIAELLTLRNFVVVLTDPSFVRSISNTLIIALVGGGIATVCVALIAITAKRSTFPFASQLETVALLPRVLPGVVAGIGMFYAVVFFPPLSLMAGTIWVLAAAYTIRTLPTAYGAIAPTIMQLSPDLDRAAWVVGASWGEGVRTVILPLLRPALITVFAVFFTTFLKEYSVAIFLVNPRTEVIGTKLLQSWIAGEMGYVAALACIQIILTVIILALINKLFGTKINAISQR